MTSLTKNGDRFAFFLGAGAAAVSGVPLIGNFREATNAVLAAGFTVDKRQNLFEHGIKVWDSWGPKLTIEELYVLADLKSRVWGAINNREGEVEAIQFLIAETIEQSAHESGQHTHDEFIRHVAGKPNSVIISSNWDISIDNAIFRSGMAVNYGANVWFQNQLPQEAAQGMPYLKIHGSLNWGRCPSADCDGWTAFPAEKVGAGAFLENQFQCGTCQTTGLRPAFIPPLAQKMETAHPDLVTIWQSAFRALREASQLVIVGYSLPITDAQVQMLLVDAIGRKDSKVAKVHIVAPPDAARDQRYQDLAAKIDRQVQWVAHDVRYEDWVASKLDLTGGREIAFSSAQETGAIT